MHLTWPLRAVFVLTVLAVFGRPAFGGVDPSSEPKPFPVQVHLVVEGDAAPPLAGQLLVQSSAEPASEPISVPLPEARSFDLELPSAGTWKLDLEAPRYWSPGAVVWPQREEVVLRLRPTGAVTGRLVTPQGAEKPHHLDIRFAPAGKLQGFDPEVSSDQGTVRCPVADDGRWQCEVPAGLSDLHLHATGFASLFHFDVAVQVGEGTDLGSLPLQPGASILGTVEIATSLDAEPSIHVQLTAFGRGELAGPRHPDLEVLTQSIQPNERGLFQFRDLRPGVYRLVAQAEGLAPAVLERLEVHEGRESRLLHPLVLTPLASVEVRVRPPLPPGGERWKVVLLQPETSARPISGTLDATGTWRNDEIRPGFYLVRIEGPHRTRWYEQRYEVSGHSPPIEIEVPILQVEGLLTIDGEPMRSRLLFERPEGGEVVGMISSLDGEFSGDLPHPGEWRISYLGRREEKHVLGRFQIEPTDDGTPTWLDLELPETRLDGRVLDALGRAVPRALVRATSTDSDQTSDPSEARSDREGRFFFRGLQEGHYAIDALAGHQGSVRERVEIREAVDSRVELRLAGSIELTGRILTPDGRPVAAAEIYAYPRLLEWRQVGLIERVTNPAGEFVLPVPSDAAELDILVLPPGFAARLLRIPFDPVTSPQRSLDLTVDTLGGVLHLHPGGTFDDAMSSTLHRGRASMFFRPLHRWAQLHGASPRPENGWWLPYFAPGSYRLCSRRGRPCSEGELSPGGVLVLETLPTPVAPGGEGR